MTIFLKWFMTFAGCTAGILIVILPVSIAMYLAFQLYQHALAWRFRRMAEKLVEKEITDMPENEEPPSDGGTKPWV